MDSLTILRKRDKTHKNYKILYLHIFVASFLASSLSLLMVYIILGVLSLLLTEIFQTLTHRMQKAFSQVD